MVILPGMGVLNLKRPSRNFQLKGYSLAATLSRFYLLHNTELIYGCYSKSNDAYMED